MTDPSGRGASPAPGWYPDPAMPGQVRWWDGATWTSATGAAPGFGYGYVGSPGGGPRGLPLDPGKALADEGRSARTATVALVFGAAGYVVLFVTIAVLYHSLFGTFLDQIREANRTTSTTTTGGSGRVTFGSQPYSPGLLLGSGLLQIVQFGLLAVGVIFLAWFYKASQLAQAAGLPARRSPGLATAAFIIPVVNLWWPYQSVGDLFPPGDPRRRLVGRWWALWLATQFATMPLLVASFGPPVVAAAVVVAAAAVAILAARAARAVVGAVSGAHSELVARVTTGA